MYWNIEQVWGWISQYYPRGDAWPAMISETELQADLNGDVGCQDISGIAVDKDGDQRADLFLYEQGYKHRMSVTSKNVHDYLKDSALAQSFPPEFDAFCTQKPADFMPMPFPFSGQMLPDSRGKITGLMFVADKKVEAGVLPFLQHHDDIDYHVLQVPTEFLSEGINFDELSFLRSHGFYLSNGFAKFVTDREKQNLPVPFHYSQAGIRETDLDPRSLEIWLQDHFYVGQNEFGQTIASTYYQHNQESYVEPLVQHDDAFDFGSTELEDGGNLVSSTLFFFIPENYELTEDSNFAMMFASGKKIIRIDLRSVPSAAHLDMILTPSEDMQDGKPVVFVAQSSNWLFHYQETKALDHIAAKLEHEGFYVERLPYVFTGHTYRGIIDHSIAYSYNNILMENYVEEGCHIKRVYLPQYADYEFDNNLAASIYEQYGYEVIRTGDMSDFGNSDGALRCLVKVTDRGLF